MPRIDLGLSPIFVFIFAPDTTPTEEDVYTLVSTLPEARAIDFKKRLIVFIPVSSTNDFATMMKNRDREPILVIATASAPPETWSMLDLRMPMEEG